MGEVIRFLPLEVQTELGVLQRMRDDLVARRLVMVTADGLDVTIREAAVLEDAIYQIEKALSRITRQNDEAHRT